MSRDGDGKKGKLGFILLILHLISVIGIITFLWSGAYNFTPESEGFTSSYLMLLQ